MNYKLIYWALPNIALMEAMKAYSTMLSHCPTAKKNMKNLKFESRKNPGRIEHFWKAPAINATVHHIHNQHHTQTHIHSE